MISILPTGTEVKLRISDLQGVVLEAGIRVSEVSYLVAYWESGNYTEKWFHEFQFDVVGTVRPIPVGFVQ